MSDHLRLGSSPQRVPSVSSRPHWPWASYHHSSQSSISTNSTGTAGGQTPASWESRSFASPPHSGSTSVLPAPSPTSRPTQSTTMAAAAPYSGESMRHWQFTAFEWVARDVQKLREYVESPEFAVRAVGEADAEANEDFELLRESPILGDGKFKLEIARTQNRDQEFGTSTEPTTLSLYLTCLTLDYPTSDYEICASMMAALKCQDDAVGERGARAEWAWDTWQSDWTFRQGNEVWQCPLPSLSSLLENPRIRQTDSFVICVQIHSPVGPFFPTHPAAYYVPKDLLEGLESSLDNANTGDVRFICLERMPVQPGAPSPTPPHSATSQSRRSSSSSSHSFPAHTTARKRVIYAHSDILTRRSEYFATMLSSTFAETNAHGSDRKLHTIIVEEADFVTIYWLLKWVYANWLMFADEDDPRAAVEGLGAGWSAKWLSSSGISGEWDWKTFNKAHPLNEVHDELRSATSGESIHSVVGEQAKVETRPRGGAPTTGPSKSLAAQPQTAVRPGAAPASGPSRRVTGPALNTAASGTPSRSKPVPIPGAPTHYPLSPRAHRPPVIPSVDPHPHPTPAPPPASALSVYQVAHRYGMPGLAALALEHIMSTITPQSSFALLLASSIWDELHLLVEDYIVEKWEEVSTAEEFERCCEEVAAGDWGSDGGKTLMALFRRLRSPAYGRG